MTDYTLADTIYLMFTTRAFATGVPTTLAGTPVVSAYENDSITQITAGITLGVDHDSVTGLNLLTIVATGANGYESGKDYNMVITTGTVGGVSVVGEVVGTFSLERSAAAVDLANGTDGLGAIKTDTAAILVDTGTTLDNHLTDIKGTGFVKDTHSLIDIEAYADLIDDGTSGLAKIATDVAAVLVDTADMQPKLGTVTDLGGGATLGANNSDMAGATFSSATDSQEAIRDRGDAAWTTGGGSGLSPLASGTAQAGTASTIQLAAGETFADNELNGNIVKVTGGTGAGQARLITSYTGATDTAAITPNWTTNPDATSTYEVVNGPIVLSDGTPFQGADIAAILTDTAEIGAAGAGLTAINLPDQTMNITGDITGNLSGSVGSVTGAVGSVTGAVGSVTGNVGGSVGSVTGAINTAAGTIQTLDALDTAQDTQHALTQGLAKYTGPYGPGIYYDDAAANTNTTLGTDGTFNNPVSSLAAATTLAAALGALRIYITGDSTLALTGQTLTDYDFIGVGTIDLNILNLGTAASPSILTGCSFQHLHIYGQHDFSDRIEIRDSAIDDAPAAEVTKLHCWAWNCAIIGDFELDTSNDNIFDSCFSGVAGNGYPVCTATGAAGTVVFRHYSGGIGFQNLSASHTGSVETDGQVVFESGCNVNAAFSLRGNLTIVDNTAGMNSLTITATAQNLNDKIDTVDTVADAVLVDTGTTIPATLGTPAGASMSADIAAVKTETALIVADTNELQTDWVDGGRLDLILDAVLVDTNSLDGTKIPDTISLANINAEVDTAFTSQMADSVPADGTIATREQALYMILQFLTDKGAVGTTVTVRKVDGSTALMTFTLDDATSPTDITRAT